MHRVKNHIKKKFHHFTKGELAAEEIIILFSICILFVACAHAASAWLPAKVEVVQCGDREDLPEMCRLDQRCCALMNQSGMTRKNMSEPAEQPAQPYEDFGNDIFQNDQNILQDDGQIYISPGEKQDTIIE